MEKIKELSGNRKSAILIILILVALIGVILAATVGLNYGLTYSNHQKLNMLVDLEDGFDLADVRLIARYVFEGQRIYVQVSRGNENLLIITAREISEEHIDDFITRINEKYDIEIDRTFEMEIISYAAVRGWNIAAPYIFRVTLAVVLILAYVSVRYMKICMVKVPLIVFGMIVLTQALYVSVLAITRIPVTRLTMPIALVILVATTVYCIVKLEKMKSKTIEESPKK